MRFENKVALVTGSARGIGLAVARRLAEEGAAVIVHGPEDGRELEEAWSALSEFNPRGARMACDLSEPRAIAGMFASIEERYGRLDLLVNNAATQRPFPILEMPEEEWDRVMAVNLRAPLLCAQAAARLMIGRGGGKIVNVGSVHESQVRPGYAHYGSAKAGLLMLTRNLALELAEHNIQVNQVSPGAVATGMTDPERQRRFATAVPAGRVGRPEEIASAVCFLASAEADYITGASLTVDGGLTLGFCANRRDL